MSVAEKEMMFFNQLTRELKLRGFEEQNYAERNPGLTPVIHFINPNKPEHVANDYLRIGFREGSIIVAIKIDAKRKTIDAVPRADTLQRDHYFLHVGTGGLYYRIIDIEKSDPWSLSNELCAAFNEYPKPVIRV